MEAPLAMVPSHATGKGPDWLETGRLLRAFDLAGDGRGRRAYVAWLETRAANSKGKIDEEAMKALRRGWYLGDAGFRDRLIAMMEKPSTKRKRPAGIPKSHGQAEAERLAVAALTALGMPGDLKSLASIRKGQQEKVLIAALLRERTAVGNPWIAQRLAMGHPGSVSRLVVACGRCPSQIRELAKLKQLLKCDT